MGRRRIQPIETNNKTSVSLENYHNLLCSPISVDANTMTVEQLNEILQMHGYRKNHRLPKEEVLEALGKIPLQTPERSTLNQTRCPYGYVPTLEEVNRDLESLGWEEEESTVVESIETVNYKAVDIAVKSDGRNVIRRKRNTGRKIEDNLGMVIPRKRRSDGGRKRRKYKEVNADGSVGADGLISAVDCLDYGPNLWGFSAVGFRCFVVDG